MITHTRDSSSNIAGHVTTMARRHPHSLAVVCPDGRDSRGRVRYTHYTFQQLDDESNRLAAGLEAHGISRGVHTVLMVKPSLDFFALTFALFKVGAVPVLVDPGLGIRNLGKCLDEAEPRAFIGIPQAHVARLLFGWGRGRIETRVTSGRRLFWGGATLDHLRRSGHSFRMTDHDAEEVAAILFTSGSTGPPKGAVYTHGNFMAQVEMLRDLYAIEPGEIDLPTFPLFALFDPALGMTAILPEMDYTRPARVDPRRIFEAIDNFGVTNMFGSPALIDRVARHGDAHGVTLPTLKRVISAGAPVPPSTLARFSKMLTADAEIFTPYGATESLPVASIGSHEVLSDTGAGAGEGRGVCVGQPVAGVRLEIIEITDDPIPHWSDDLRVAPGRIGEVVVGGPMVTHRYYNRDEATALAKIDDAGTTLHRMGDLGYRDELGRLWFCGRKSQRITLADRELYTIPCEGIFNAHPEVFRSAMVRVTIADTPTPVLCVEREKHSSSPPERLREELLRLGAAHEITAGIDEVLFHRAFPVDIRHNAKIFREKLADWAAKELS